jgi:hypothetical protein
MAQGAAGPFTKSQIEAQRLVKLPSAAGLKAMKPIKILSISKPPRELKPSR